MSNEGTDPRPDPELDELVDTLVYVEWSTSNELRERIEHYTQRRVAEAVERERAECARVAEQEGCEWDAAYEANGNGEYAVERGESCRAIAAAIRGRSGKRGGA